MGDLNLSEVLPYKDRKGTDTGKDKSDILAKMTASKDYIAPGILPTTRNHACECLVVCPRVVAHQKHRIDANHTDCEPGYAVETLAARYGMG
jgi:hypothetical protein